MELNKSILLQKQVRDNTQDLHSEFLDMKQWEEQMKQKEREVLAERSKEQILPAIRKKNKKPLTKEKKSIENSKRIKAFDYTAWDKFDVDKACKESEEDEELDENLEEPISRQELKANYAKATEHKQQGNTFVQKKEWNKAIASYSEAIKIFPYDAIFYANRALCYLKQDNLYSVEADSSSAIQLDKTYIKAYHRRATARMGLKQYAEAKQDIEKMLLLEPSNSDAKILLSEVDKQLEKSKPIIISGEDTTKDISIEKKIAKKLINSNKKIVDTKEDKNKNNAKVESPVKSATVNVTELKRNLIPDWLPEKDNVEIVESIEKPPHLRSKEHLKRILVQEADLSKPFEENIKIPSNKNYVELSDVHNDSKIKHNEEVKQSQSEQNCTEDCTETLPIPNTAIQFLLSWRKCTSTYFRYKYLKQLSPSNLSKIFGDSMESDIFNDILSILKSEFMERQEPIFSYLEGLSNIRRFRTFIMFVNDSEKQDLKLMFSYCKEFGQISEEKLVELQNKYEI